MTLATTRRTRTIVLAAVLAGVAAAAGASSAPPAADVHERSALGVVGRMLNALGDCDAPYRVERIAFTFSVERDGKIAGSRRHLWFPRSGRHIVRFRPDGAPEDGSGDVRVDWNLHRKRGVATMVATGAPIEGEELKPLLEAADRMWVNDTYWLLMPYKVLDPGVRLAYEGEETIDGRTFDKVRVTFDQVGFTPGDTYWAYVARDSGLMERWAFVLEGREPPPVAWEWTGYAHHGPLLLAGRKQRVGAAQAILTHKILVR